MQTAVGKFLMLIERNRQLASSVHLLKAQITVRIDFSDVYRTQVVAQHRDFVDDNGLYLLQQLSFKTSQWRQHFNIYNRIRGNLEHSVNCKAADQPCC